MSAIIIIIYAISPRDLSNTVMNSFNVFYILSYITSKTNLNEQSRVSYLLKSKGKKIKSAKITNH